MSSSPRCAALRGASAAVLLGIRHHRATLLLTTTLLVEYEAVCHLAEHRLAAGLDTVAVDRFLDGLVGLAEPVEVLNRMIRTAKPASVRSA